MQGIVVLEEERKATAGPAPISPQRLGGKVRESQREKKCSQVVKLLPHPSAILSLFLRISAVK